MESKIVEYGIIYNHLIKAPNQSVVKNISMFFQENVNMLPFHKAFVKRV